VTSTILGIIIMTLISIDSEKSFGNIRWQVNFKSYITQFLFLINFSKIYNNILLNKIMQYLGKVISF
jgi:hypothetical protein